MERLPQRTLITVDITNLWYNKSNEYGARKDRNLGLDFYIDSYDVGDKWIEGN